MAVETHTLEPAYNMRPSHQLRGNVNLIPYAVTIPAGAVAGDTLTTAFSFPGGAVYTGLEVRTAGNTAGLTIDVGYVGAHGYVGTDNLTAFVDDHAVAASGREELLTGMPVAMTRDVDLNIDHRLAVTLGGTVTEGETVQLWFEQVDSGRI